MKDICSKWRKRYGNLAMVTYTKVSKVGVDSSFGKHSPVHAGSHAAGGDAIS